MASLFGVYGFEDLTISDMRKLTFLYFAGKVSVEIDGDKKVVVVLERGGTK